MSAFTPGPWLAAAKPSSVVGWPVVAPKDMGRSICNITVGHEYSEANARLIAAAPDIYEALDLILPLALRYTASHQVGSNQVYCDMARAALAKAKGEA